MNTGLLRVQQRVFPKALCAASVFSLGLMIWPGSTEAGGKDPSLSKPTASLSCSELDAALYETNRDLRKVKGDLNSDRENFELRKGFRKKSEAKVVSLKKQVKSESDPQKKKTLKTDLVEAQNHVQAQKRFIAELTADIRDGERAIKQAEKRRDRLKKQRKKLGC